METQVVVDVVSKDGQSVSGDLVVEFPELNMTIRQLIYHNDNGHLSDQQWFVIGEYQTATQFTGCQVHSPNIYNGLGVENA